MKKPKYVIKKAANKAFYFCFKSPNGQMIMCSEMYSSKEAVKRAIKFCQKHATTQIIEEEIS